MIVFRINEIECWCCGVSRKYMICNLILWVETRHIAKFSKETKLHFWKRTRFEFYVVRHKYRSNKKKKGLFAGVFSTKEHWLNLNAIMQLWPHHSSPGNNEIFHSSQLFCNYSHKHFSRILDNYVVDAKPSMKKLL